MQRMANHNLLSQVNRKGEYPIAQPSFPNTSNYRLPCPRKIFGLLYYPGDRGITNRHIWNEMQVCSFIAHLCKASHVNHPSTVT